MIATLRDFLVVGWIVLRHTFTEEHAFDVRPCHR